MKLLPWASAALFRSLEAADAWLGLPEKLAESLAFRRDWRSSLKAERSAGPALWIHGASVGELEDLAAFFPNPALLRQAGFEPDQVMLTASSVSARERLKEWSQKQGLRYAGPLPPEKTAEADAFLEALSPSLMILSHADIWPLVLERAERHLTKGLIWLPTHPSSAETLAPRCLSKLLTHVGTRDPRHLEHWKTRLPHLKHCFIGNPRIDRIAKRIEAARDFEDHVLSRYQASPEPDKVSILLGSVWIEDADLWSAALKALRTDERARLQIVALPHQSDDAHMVASIQHRLPEARIPPVQGILLEAYSRFTLAYVGGGLKTGLHNVLEPALWGSPVLCGGLRTSSQPEFDLLVKLGVLRSLRDPDELASQLRDLLVTEKFKAWKIQCSEASPRWEMMKGATQRLTHLVSSARQSHS